MLQTNLQIRKILSKLVHLVTWTEMIFVMQIQAIANSNMDNELKRTEWYWVKHNHTSTSFTETDFWMSGRKLARLERIKLSKNDFCLHHFCLPQITLKTYNFGS